MSLQALRALTRWGSINNLLLLKPTGEKALVSVLHEGPHTDSSSFPTDGLLEGELFGVFGVIMHVTQ